MLNSSKLYKYKNMSGGNKPLPQVPEIAGLKMFGCILILLHHIVYSYAHIEPSRSFLTFGSIDLYPLIVNGWIGIYIFFAILGYFAMRSWWWHPNRSYKKYAIARIRKILPIYYFVIFILVIGIFPDYVTFLPPSGFSIAYHIFMIPDIMLPDILVLLATTAAEFKIVLILPFIFLFCLRGENPNKRLVWVLISLVLIGLAFRIYGYSKFYPVHIYAFDYFQFFLHTMAAFVYCLDPVIAGIIVGYFEMKSKQRSKAIISKKQAKYIFWGAMLILFIWLFKDEKLLVITFYDGAFQMITVGIICGLLLLGVVFGGAPKFFSNGFSRYVARLSYAAYLTHIPIIASCYRIFSWFPALSGSHTQNFIVVTIVYLFATWLLAELTQRFVEEPFIKNIKHLRKKA